MVINLYVDVISQPLYNSLSYQYSYVNGQLLLSQFADDTCLVSNSVSSCQFLTAISCQFFAWALMKVNVAKCRCLAISSRSKQTVFDPELIIGDKSAPFIGSMHHIQIPIGLPLDMHRTPEATKELLLSRLRYLCDTVDGLPLRRQQKIKVYKLYVCPGMAWLLGLLDLSLSCERKLDSVPTRFLKKWCGLAATTNPSILYLPEESFGLSLPKLSTTFQSIISCNLRYLLQSKDPMVQQLAEAEVHHQQQLCNRKFVPATLASSSLSCKDIRKVTEGAR